MLLLLWKPISRARHFSASILLTSFAMLLSASPLRMIDGAIDEMTTSLSSVLIDEARSMMSSAISREVLAEFRLFVPALSPGHVSNLV